MKLAYVTFEYPTDHHAGGISTYVRQAATLLAERGHEVHVFIAGNERSGRANDGLVHVHRIAADRMDSFRERYLPTLLSEHESMTFDAVEFPEIGALGSPFFESGVKLPSIVKLHTPTYLIDRINWELTPATQRLRSQFAAFRGAIKPYWKYDRSIDEEARCGRQADLVVGPSLSITEIVATDWELSREQCRTTPNPYVPSAELLAIPARAREVKTILYFGRLEPRKGVLYLPPVFKEIAAHRPGLQFRFVGADQPHLDRKHTVGELLKKQLEGIDGEVRIDPPVSAAEIPSLLATADIAVFPSHWENYPGVCLESMSAGLPVIGSLHGGMAEMLGRDGERGFAINPRDHREFVSALVRLIDHPQTRERFAKAGRDWILETLSLEKIGPRLEADFLTAVEHHQRRNGTAG